MTRYDDMIDAELADTLQAERMRRGLRAAAPSPPAPQTGKANPSMEGPSRAAARNPCPYCGRESGGRACPSHRDLLAVDPHYQR